MAATSMSTEECVTPLIFKNRSVLQHYGEDSGDEPRQPAKVGHVFDPVKAREPLRPFLKRYNDSIYGPPSHIDSEIQAPEKPSSYTDPYLYPTLTSNEFARLNAVWYYTRGLENDEQTLTKLDRMLDLVKQSLGWEIGIIGLLDATTYTRLITENIDRAVLNRRESTCSHTVNVESGTVFSVMDMTMDWRFQKWPPVEFGGLRSYAGTQLRLPIGIGEDVVLGSLCVASTTVRQPLSETEKKRLIRAADLIMYELVGRTRLIRMKEKQNMLTSLNTLRTSEASKSLEATALNVIKSHYPEADIFITNKSPTIIEMGNDVSVPVSSFEDGAWEDIAFLENIVSQSGDRLPHPKQAVRALMGIIPADGRAIVVATKEIKFVLDEIDTWFVSSVAQHLGSAIQAKALREALEAKERFLRTITHDLRTPIHAVLSCTELLGDEIKARQMAKDLTQESIAESCALLNSFLQTIRQSGTELMTTVNNILRLNSSTHNSTSSFPRDYDLKHLEADVLGEVLANYSEDQLHGLSIRFKHEFDGPQNNVHIDADLLKELVKCLVFNAVAATPSGVILVFTSIKDSKIIIEVEDNGCGIDPADHCRIFLPFEKVLHSSKGPGLGLSLATQMANTLGGELCLKKSTLGQGSKFELILPYVEANSNNIVPVRQWSQDTTRLPRKYHVMTHSQRDLHLLEHLEHHLQLRGIQKSDSAEDCLIVMNQPNVSSSHDISTISSLSEPHFVIAVVGSSIDEASTKRLQDEMQPHCTVPLTGPFFSSRLDEQLIETYAAFLERKNKTPVPARPILNEKMSGLQLTSSNMAGPATSPLELHQETLLPVQERPLRALLVDDNDVNLTVLKFFCKKRSIPHGTAVNGLLAITAFCESMSLEPYTLILLDLQMPECDGVQACKQIRTFEQAKGLAPAIIFMITGQDSVTDRRNSFEAGVDDFFVKPVSLKKLERAISEYFRRPT